MRDGTCLYCGTKIESHDIRCRRMSDGSWEKHFMREAIKSSFPGADEAKLINEVLDDIGYDRIPRKDLQWQMVCNDRWLLGEAVRGFVRNAVASVAKVPYYPWNWYWEILKIDGKFGSENHIESAIESAERALGLENP